MICSKISTRIPGRCGAMLAAAVIGVTSFTATTYGDQTKADNSNNLNLGTSWVSGVAPGATDVAIFNSTLATPANNAFALGANLSWAGVRVVDPSANLTFLAGNTLTLGASGINMTAALRNLTMNNALTLTGAGETWDTGTTSTVLTVGALNLGTGTLTVQGAGTTTMAGKVSGGSNTRIIENGPGTLVLSGINNTLPRLSVAAGTVMVASASALPSAAVVNADGGTLDLNGRNATVSQLTGVAGIITDNSGVAGTTGLRVNQSATTTFSGTISDGPTRHLALIKDNSGSFTLSGANTYSGGTTLNRGFLVLNNNQALGTADLTINTVGGNPTRLVINGGITISNNITSFASVAQAGNNGIFIFGAGTGNATFDGNITLAGPNVTSGGDIAGPGTTGQFMIFDGPIVAGPAHSLIIVRSGNVMFAGGGSYQFIDLRTGTTLLGSNNGMATTAIIDTGGNGAETWDLNGFNQSIVGLKNTVNPGNGRTITSSTGPSVLTFTPSGADSFTFGGGAGASAMTGNLSIVMAGAPTGVQTFSTATSTYTGTTTLTSGILAVTSLSFAGTGGSSSSIGGSSNDPSNLVFDGGTLRYIGFGDVTDRGFTINPGKTATFDIQGSTTALGMGGNTPATTGGLAKLGLGSLVLSGNYAYTGGTAVNNGLLLVSGTLAAGSTVTVGNGATLGGGGVIGGTASISSGGVLSPGVGGIGTLTMGGLSLNGGSVLNLEFDPANATSNDLMVVTSVGGLAVNGGNLNLFAVNTTTPFANDGNYTLFTYNSAFSGALSSLAITDPLAGKTYALTNNTSSQSIALTIGDGVISEWQNAGGSAWTTGTNWNNGIPNAVGVTAKFGSQLQAPGGTVTLSGNQTVSGIIFDNFNSYTIGGAGGGTLILDNGVASAAISVNSGLHTIAAPIQLNSGMAITLSAGNSLTISGNINGAHGLALAGGGFLTLSGLNSYTTTTVSNGTLNVGNGTTSGNLGTGDVQLGAAGTLNFNRTDALSVANNINGVNGTVAQSGSGTVTLSGNNNFGTAAGGLNISSGTVRIGSATGLPVSVLLQIFGGTLDLNGNNGTVNGLNGSGLITDTAAGAGTTSLTVDGPNSSFFSGALNDGPSRKLALLKTDSGTLSLGAASTYSGGTTLSQGVLNPTIAGALGTGTIILTTLGSNSTRLDVGGNLDNPIVINAVNPGSGLGSINGTASATLSGNISVNIASPGGAGHVSGPLSGGTLVLTGALTGSAPIIIRNGFVELAGTGNYPQLQIQQGTTLLGANNAIDPTTSVLMGSNGGATLDLNGFNQTLPSLIQAANNNVVTSSTGPGTLTLDPTIDDTLGGGLLLQGSLTLVKTGPATAFLSGNSPYLGQTFINQGTLNISANNTIGAVGTGASVTLNGGTLQTAGTFALDNGTNGNSRNISILSGGGTFDLTAGNTLTISGIISGTGPVALTGGVLLITGAASYSGTTTIADIGTAEFAGGVTHNTGLFAAAGAVQIDAATTLRIQPNATLTNRTSTLGNLILSGTTGAWTSTLDLTNNNLIVTNGANVQDQIKQAANLGAWNATSGGITSSSALAAATTSTATALAYASGAEYTSATGNTLFDGIAFNPTDTLIKYTLAGDANMDGSVTFADFLALQNDYNKPGDWSQGDWNYDGQVTFADFLILQNNYNKVLGAGNVAAAVSTGAAPEPATLLLLAASLPAMLLGRRRRAV